MELGPVPHYMFFERETGPVMSAYDGKVQIIAVVSNPLKGNRHFMLQYVRHRDHTKTFDPFLMEYDSRATWVEQL